MCVVLFPYPNKAKLQRDDTVSKDAGTWHSSYSVINLLISVQNELISRANSLSKTWVKYFYVFALAQRSCPTAQWTKSLSDTNNPPTLSSAASLERCQVHWVYVLWGDPSSVWLACWLGTKRWSLWSPLLTMTLLLTVSPVTHSEATGQHTGPNKNISLYHQWPFTGRETDYSWQWRQHFSVNYRLLQFLFLHFATVSVGMCHRLNEVKCVREGVIIF